MISFICNKSKEDNDKVVDSIKALQKEHFFEGFFVFDFPLKDEETIKKIKNSELIVILGGDGTVLSSLFYLDYKVPPIIPVNIGNLGFVTIALEEFQTFFLDYLLKKEEAVKIDERYLVEADFQGKRYYALNDFVLQKNDRKKMLIIECSFSGSQVIKKRVDGLIISTPTGSTAYNLSAGGPIMNPNGIPAMIFNPICPHSLTVKPIIMTKRDELLVRAYHVRDVESDKSFLVIDGVHDIEIEAGEPVYFRVSREKVTFYKPKADSYYNTLNRKMNWAL